MREALQYKCDLFAKNYIDLNKTFKWNDSINNRLGALLYTMDNRAVDSEAISRCRKIIKDNTGIFSQFKDLTNFLVSVMLSLHSEPEASFKGILQVYGDLKAEGFHASHYLVLAATTVALHADSLKYKQIVMDAKKHYQAMKEDHRFITSYDDYGIAALLAMSELPVPQTEREMENCFRILKEDFFGSNAVQSLAQVLAFSEENYADKCRRVRELNNELRKRKCKFGSDIELSLLAVLSLLGEESMKLSEEIAELTEYLKEKKGFGGWSVSSKERLLFASALVCNEYLQSGNDLVTITLSSSVISILLAQQMAVITASAVAASAAATSTSS